MLCLLDSFGIYSLFGLNSGKDALFGMIVFGRYKLWLELLSFRSNALFSWRLVKEVF